MNPPPPLALVKDTPTDERFTDLGNAKRMVRLFGDQIRYCHPFNAWYIYREGQWGPDRVGAIMQKAKATVADLFREAGNTGDSAERKLLFAHALKSESLGRLNAMIDLARSEVGVPILPERMDSHPHLLNLANGTLDLHTGTLGPHDPRHLITTQLPFDYEPHATAPQWTEFLARVQDNKGDMLGFLQRAVGYSLSGSMHEQCFFFLFGSGANGKSVFLKTLLAMFGDSARTAAFSTFLAQRDSGRPRPDLARLAGARLVTAAEAGEGQRFDEELLKSITGGERITARKLYAEEFEFTPQCALWLAANHRPTIRGGDFAIWRRVCLIPFTVTIPDEEQDHSLADRLLGELPGILNWALDGYRQWQEGGLNKPAAVIVATEEYREESDPLRDFLSERCVSGEGRRESATALYSAYRSWCNDNGETVRSKKWLGGGLRERGFHAVKSHGTMVYHGLSLDLRGGYDSPAESPPSDFLS